jgi:hypothetical protein
MEGWFVVETVCVHGGDAHRVLCGRGDERGFYGPMLYDYVSSRFETEEEAEREAIGWVLRGHDCFVTNFI